MMTLEQAIEYYHEKAEEIRKANEEMPTDCKLSEDLCECAAEHEQLASWLTELQERREADKWASTKERMPEKDGVYLVAIQYVAKYEKGSPIHTIELLASYDTKYGQWSSPDNVIAWRNLPKPYESEDK